MAKITFFLLSIVAITAISYDMGQDDRFVHFNGTSVIMQCPRVDSTGTGDLSFWWYEIFIRQGAIRFPSIFLSNSSDSNGCKNECGQRSDCFAALSTCTGNCYIVTTTMPQLCQLWYRRKEGHILDHCTKELPCMIAYKICQKPRCSLANMAKLFCDTNNKVYALNACDMSVDAACSSGDAEHISKISNGDYGTDRRGIICAKRKADERSSKNQETVSRPLPEKEKAAVTAKILTARGYLSEKFHNLETKVGGMSDEKCTTFCLDRLDCRSAQLIGEECRISDQDVHLPDIKPGNGTVFRKYYFPPDLVKNCEDMWEEYPQKILIGQNRLMVDAPSYARCLEACLSTKEFECKSGLFYAKEEKKNCILNTETKNTRRNLFKDANDEERVVYFEPKCGKSISVPGPSGETRMDETVSIVKTSANVSLTSTQISTERQMPANEIKKIDSSGNRSQERVGSFSTAQQVFTAFITSTTETSSQKSEPATTLTNSYPNPVSSQKETSSSTAQETSSTSTIQPASSAGSEAAASTKVPVSLQESNSVQQLVPNLGIPILETLHLPSSGEEASPVAQTATSTSQPAPSASSELTTTMKIPITAISKVGDGVQKSSLEFFYEFPKKQESPPDTSKISLVQWQTSISASNETIAPARSPSTSGAAGPPSFQHVGSGNLFQLQNFDWQPTENALLKKLFREKPIVVQNQLSESTKSEIVMPTNEAKPTETVNIMTSQSTMNPVNISSPTESTSRSTMGAILLNNLVIKVFGKGSNKSENILDCPSGNRSKYDIYNTNHGGIPETFQLAAEGIENEYECRKLCYSQTGCYLAVVAHGSRKCYTLSESLPKGCESLKGGFGDDKHTEKCTRKNRCEWIMKMCRRPYCTLLQIADLYCKTKDKKNALASCTEKIPYEVWA